MNNLGQRTSITRNGLAHATPDTDTIGYDAKGQVVKTDNSTNPADPAFNHLYSFDGIGNRLTDNRLTDNLSTYTLNNVNEITAITTAGNTITTTHDADGNTLTGTLPEDTTGATLEWDANNRLTKITKSNGTVTEYTYDYMSRRISKTTAGTTTRWIYNGWNPIAIYNNTSLQKTYLWGQDISGGIQSAGGVGGLLSVTEHGSQPTTHYPLYDGNGNITDYIDSTATVVAHYQYDAFGNTIIKTGTKADHFTHRFSTKQRDTESGLYYYGYRYYDPVTGRWPSRDPLGEMGHETVKLHLDHEEFTYQQELKADLAFYSSTLTSRLNQAKQGKLSKDEVIDLIDDFEYVQEVEIYLNSYGLSGMHSNFAELLSEGPSLYAFVGNDALNYFDVLGEAKGGKQNKKNHRRR